MSAGGKTRGTYLFWTKEMVSYLERNWSKKTGKAIAEELSVLFCRRKRKKISAAAVSGKAHYMGLQRKTMVGRPPTRPPKRKLRRAA